MGSSWIIVAFILVLFAVFRYVFPEKNAKYSAEKNINTLSKKYRKFDLVMIPIAFLFLIGYTAVIGFMLHFISELRFLVFKQEGIFIKPEFGMWMLPGFFIGALFYTGTFNKIVDRHWKSDADEYRAYYNLKYHIGFDWWKALRWITLGAFIIGAVIALFMADSYAYFQKDKLVLNPVFSLGKKEFAYQDLAIIAEVSHFKAPNVALIRIWSGTRLKTMSLF